MIHEYALEPELVASLTDRRAAKYLAEKFGLGQPRLASRYPKRWKALAWDAFQQSHPNCSEGQKKVVEELIQRLSETMVRRPDASFDSGRSWLENAEMEHARNPFHGILARANPRGREEVLLEQDLTEETMQRWGVARGLVVERRAGPMADLISPLLRCCGEAIFIDPHFGPENARHRRVLEAFLVALAAGRNNLGIVRVEVQTGNKLPAEFFRNECQKLRRHIPAGLKVTIRQWAPRPGGEALHNRYILTDLGGLIFSHGLDEGRTGETDDINLMDRDQYRLRWSQYVGDKPAFDPLASLVVTGSKAI